MSQEQNAGKKTSTENFADMFRAFGQAVSEIFNDPELKEKAKEFAESAAESAKTFRSRFKD
jgi:tRNA(Ser,Leu) C12 N-acetylase TAN1